MSYLKLVNITGDANNIKRYSLFDIVEYLIEIGNTFNKDPRH